MPVIRRKIVFLTSSSVFSGGDRHLVELIRRLDVSKVEPVVLCFREDRLSRVLNEQLRLGVRVETGFSRTEFFRTWLGLRRQRAEAVVIVSGALGSFAWYIFLAARLSGAKRVFAIYHNFSDALPAPSRAGNLVLRLARHAFGYPTRRLVKAKLAAALTHRSVCVSQNLRDQLIGSLGFPPDRTFAVLNGVDVGYYGGRPAPELDVRRQLGIGASEIVLVSACRLVPAKGLDVLLRAVASLQGEIPNLSWIAVGDGPSASELRKASAEMGLSSKVFFVGFKDDVRPYLRTGDIFVNPSSTTFIETVGLATMEAMATGMACIAAKAGGVPEIISDKEDGLLVTPGSVDELRQAIKRLASEPVERKRMGGRAKERALRNFDLDQCMDRIKCILFQGEQGAPQPTACSQRGRTVGRSDGQSQRSHSGL